MLKLTIVFFLLCKNMRKRINFNLKLIEINLQNRDGPAFEAMFEEIEECLLHHICHLVTLERRPDQYHGPHGWDHVVGGRRFLKIRENDQSG